MYVIPVLISIVAWLASILYLNQATMGVGAVAAACWFAIVARIIQQDSHHRALMKLLREASAAPRSGPLDDATSSAPVAARLTLPTA